MKKIFDSRFFICLVCLLLSPILISLIVIYYAIRTAIDMFMALPCLFGIHDYESIGYMDKCKRCGHSEVN